MTQNPITSAPRPPSGQDVYDALMGAIDLDLVSVSLPHLEEKYRGESPSQRRERFERYKRDFEKYEAAYAEWSANFHLAVSAYRHGALSSAESESRNAEHAALAQMESQFHTEP